MSIFFEPNLEDNHVINVIDSPMGAGKTTAIMDYIKSIPKNEKFVYATPYNDEGKRVFKACGDKDVAFLEDKKNDGMAKTPLFYENASKGNSIICTHQLLPYLNQDIYDTISRTNYTLVIDEAYDVITFLEERDRRRIKYLKKHGLITINEKTGCASFINEEEARQFSDMDWNLARRITSGRIFVESNDDSPDKMDIVSLIFPIELFNSFHKVIVMTYMYDAHPMSYYMRCNGYKEKHFGVHKIDDGHYEVCLPEQADGFRYNVKDKIHILYDDKLNELGEQKSIRSQKPMSVNWYKKDEGHKKTKQIGLNVRNLQRYIYKCSAKDFIWTCYESCREYMEDKNIKKAFLTWNARASNSKSHTHYLAYTVNPNNKPDLYNYFLHRDYKFDCDKWALSNMVQWIWRSAIRNGEDIYIYIPSKRMRTLLENWIDEVSAEGGEADV